MTHVIYMFYISHRKEIKRNFHNCIEMKYNLDVITKDNITYFMLYNMTHVI